jgi:hypothetical protein
MAAIESGKIKVQKKATAAVKNEKVIKENPQNGTKEILQT